ncbi:MAG: LytR C-terminal domain-containing protein [Deltaproteobacteria bacterium]|jgi:hypothetical protein|nr:LytR C-terminal domain-containing protein [Deltaproteobacteria bacterium]
MKCPHCGNKEIVFLRRTRWARFVPGFEYYDCNRCGGTHSRFLVRPIHGLFFAIMAFLITTAGYWFIRQMPVPYYADIDKEIVPILEPVKVSGRIDDPLVREKEIPVQIAGPSFAEPSEEIDGNTPSKTPPVLESVREATQTDTGALQMLQANEPRVKVLIGNKSRASAERLAVQLESMGYPVGKIHAAPRSTFRKLTIFYKEGFKTLAGEIGRRLGKDFRSKELSWESQFDIIVVTGGNEK